jgi:hypothetical protein
MMPPDLQRREGPSMRVPVLETPWFPVVLGVLVADLNFWYFASTGENDADYAGIALFGLGAVYWLSRFATAREARWAIAALGALAALGLMVMRETGTFDYGFIPPYVVFLVFVWAGGLFRR